MAKELAYVLINPHTIRKSRTGGVIARYRARTDLDFVAARMFSPSAELAERYAALVEGAADSPDAKEHLLAEYIRREYAPDAASGKGHRVMMLLFEGEDAVRKIYSVTGTVTPKWGSGLSIRDTFGDYVLNADGSLRYFEPAVMVGPSVERAGRTLRLWAKYSETDGGIVGGALDVQHDESAEKTLVILKPDNFRSQNLRAGSIVDILSSSGLRIVAARKFCMTVAQAEAFYAPVKVTLESKFPELSVEKLGGALSREFGFSVDAGELQHICQRLAPGFSHWQFENIVEFMTGYRPSSLSVEEKEHAAKNECLALIYEGPAAVQTIREILGTTDPTKARPGSVRREFGSCIMVNAAHASDSPENAEREMNIINVAADTIRPYVERYYCL